MDLLMAFLCEFDILEDIYLLVLKRLLLVLVVGVDISQEMGEGWKYYLADLFLGTVVEFFLLVNLL